MSGISLAETRKNILQYFFRQIHLTLSKRILVIKITNLDQEEMSGPENTVFVMFIYSGFLPQ